MWGWTPYREEYFSSFLVLCSAAAIIREARGARLDFCSTLCDGRVSLGRIVTFIRGFGLDSSAGCYLFCIVECWVRTILKGLCVAAFSKAICFPSGGY